ncbi:hypothetical protein QSJ18_17575 [Gordonia sp. ABSL1-1]|uniref:hypothetical protein n=1 Tax=Gordonia sp. ABSL1-1 TaxID=3053923 RepID=UPI0025741E21|nr:hypothetical protein [Gordonia sp. ABSL1-1]MDL9938559.1 hypothetical protein [Gordonia sp. ABSL1-1]
MTTFAYFLIAVLALAGAAALLWLDRRRSSVARHQRAVWGDTHSFKFRESDTKLRKVFRRATMNVPDHVLVQDVAFGEYEGAEAVVFDLVDTATVVGVRRSSPSRVVVDLRHEDVLAPVEEDVELLGAMGPRVMFSNNLDVARRVCDRRMVTLATKAPAYIEVLWNEGNWALGSLPLTNDSRDLDTALDVVRRFADLLRVLPPVRDPEGPPDPRDPHGPTRAELADEKTESMRDKARRRAAEASAATPERPARTAATSVRTPPPYTSSRPDAPARGRVSADDRDLPDATRKGPALDPKAAESSAAGPAASPRTRGARGLSPMPVRRNAERPSRPERD